MSRANSTLEVTASNLRVGENLYPVNRPLAHKLARKASDDDLLEAYLDFVRSLRNQQAGNVWLRTQDLDVLAAVLGRTTEAVQADLEGRMAVQRHQAARLRTKRRRTAFAAFGVAIVGSALVVAAPGRASNQSMAAPVQIGSALTIERTAGAHGDATQVTEVTPGWTSPEAAEAGVELGPAQVITRG